MKKVPDCVKTNARKVRKLRWLPKTCAYRILAEGKDSCVPQRAEID